MVYIVGGCGKRYLIVVADAIGTGFVGDAFTEVPAIVAAHTQAVSIIWAS